MGQSRCCKGKCCRALVSSQNFLTAQNLPLGTCETHAHFRIFSARQPDLSCATGTSTVGRAEAQWKQEGRFRCGLLRNPAHRRCGFGHCKQRKLRRIARSCAVVRGFFDTAHNLKVTGSNPVPATIKTKYLKWIEPDAFRRVFAIGILVNAWSTFDQAPLRGPGGMCGLTDLRLGSSSICDQSPAQRQRRTTKRTEE